MDKSYDQQIKKTLFYCFEKIATFSGHKDDESILTVDGLDRNQQLKQ